WQRRHEEGAGAAGCETQAPVPRDAPPLSFIVWLTAWAASGGFSDLSGSSTVSSIDVVSLTACAWADQV
ncbi:unnamed protein product, partial [Urochloa humidicola]